MTRAADFGLLRLLLATSVVFAHFAAIFDARTSMGLSATIAVQAFFVVSGWVVAASFANSSGTAAFWVRRAARLYPLYAVVVLCQGLAGAALASTTISGSELFRYLGCNLAFANFLKPSLFGLFSEAPVKAFNPSLWTLKVEVTYYALVPVIVWVLNRHGRMAIGALFVASTAFAYAFPAETSEVGRQFPGQLRFFLAGIACWQAQPLLLRLVERHPAAALGALGLLGFLAARRLEHVASLTILQPLWVASFVFGAAHLLPRLGRAPDVSYGVYLLHAPIAQIGRHIGWLDSSRASLVALLSVTLVAAVLGCYLVELPAIRWGRRLSMRLSAIPELRPVGVPAMLGPNTPER